MCSKTIKLIFLSSFFLCICSHTITSQTVELMKCDATHNIGKLVLKSISATFFGGTRREETQIDCVNQKQSFVSGAEYPKSSGVAVLDHGSIWIGGIVGNDTLLYSLGYKHILSNEYRSILDPESPYFKDAVSEQDFIAIDQFDAPSERKAIDPVDFQITRKSFAWSYEYAEDFVLFDLEIKNKRSKEIKEVYIAIHLNFEIGYYNKSKSIKTDDVAGLYKSNRTLDNCTDFRDDFLLMWGADNNGDPVDGKFTDKLTLVDEYFTKSATSVSGVFFLDNLRELFNLDIKTSYNWWTYDPWLTYDFGPQSKERFREFDEQNIGRPITDEDYYHILSNSEIDYDQIYTASIKKYDPVWHYPNQEHSVDISDGYFIPYNVLSVGPFDLSPGAVLKIPFAYVAGENFHTKPSNIDNLPDFPQSYYRNLDFSDLTKNAQWARWVYDNPSVDTDGDGDSGRYMICVSDSLFVDNEWQIVTADTFWYRGDGVPDWRAAAPPPPPIVWLEPTHNGIRIRFNGSQSETEKDIFTRIADFEGYNIYFGRDERESSLSLIASYDNENFDKYVYHSDVETYIVEDIPMTLHEIRCAYADSCNDESFDPLVSSRVDPFYKPDSLFYFTKHSYNVVNSAITKVYPNARDPRTVLPDSLVEDDYTDDGYFKFFEYEYTIENLLPTIDYWVNVTAFDFGSPKSGLKALETPKTLNIQPAYPLIHADDLSGERKQVYVYPNPYRIDANYRNSGYEGRTDEVRPDFRLREMNFANLPPKCEIKIFSLDADLIKHLSHDKQITDPTHTHAVWNMITRNTQLLVSGLYYWTVEFPDGDVQIGKFVVLM